MVRFTTAAAALLAVGVGVANAEEAAAAAAVPESEVVEAAAAYAPKVDFQYEFLETFQDDEVIKTKRWVQSGVDKYSGQSWVQTTEFETIESGIEGDKSLVVATPHKHYGLVRTLDVPVDPKGKDLVVQYEVRLHKGISCSGAYLKLLAADSAFEPELLSEDSGFSVMFGPDKCGGTNKIHLIIRVQNPITKEWEEKHMDKPAPIETDNLSHLYTLVIKNDDTFKILVDSVVKVEGTLAIYSSMENNITIEHFLLFSLSLSSLFNTCMWSLLVISPPIFGYSFYRVQELSLTDLFSLLCVYLLLLFISIHWSGSLLEDFKPSFQEPEEIEDPADSKPEDWVNDAKIVDASAVKPEDWDEDAPKMIDDPSATKPAGWEDDEPAEISDPDATMPEDWDEDDDGIWEAPLIPNPKCTVGCGEWKPAQIANPEFKGKWSAPMIENPDYVGEWAPRKIPNPGYFKVEHASDIAPIGAVAIEILANDAGIAFDNILIGHSVKEAAVFAQNTHALKKSLEGSKVDTAKRDEERKAREDAKLNGGALGTLSYYWGELRDVVVYNPVPFGIGGGILGMLFLALAFRSSGGGADDEGEYESHKKTDEGDAPDDDDDEVEEVEEDEEEEEVDDDEEEEDEKPALRKRRTPKAD
jgi:hypothetical protein